MRKAYLKKGLHEIPLDSEGCAKTDLFVYLPMAKKYVRYVREGDEVEESKVEAVKSHKVPHLYVIGGAQGRDSIPATDLDDSKQMKEEKESVKSFKANNSKTEKHEKRFSSNQEVPVLSEEEEIALLEEKAQKADDIPDDEFKSDLIGEEAAKKIEDLWEEINNVEEEDNPQGTLGKLESVSDEIIDSLVGNHKDLKKRLLRNLRYIHLMNDVSAITALSCLVGYANGFDSKKSYRDIIVACLVMDSSLVEIDRKDWEKFICDPDSVPEDVANKIRKHPDVSHKMVASNLKMIPDASLQLVFNHHELHNGKGYPRGIRNGSLSPVSRVLAFSVDLFEMMKAASFQGKPSSVPYLLRHLINEKIESHKRRHNLDYVRKTLQFIESP